MFNGNKLQQLRKNEKLNQKELADKLNINQVSISKYELGKNMPSIENLELIADYFDVSIDYLMDRDSESKYANHIFTEIIDGYNKLGQKEKDDYIFFMKNFLYHLTRSTQKQKSESQDSD